MYLHNDRDLFTAVIFQISQLTAITPTLIEKDYYVFMILKLIHQKSGDNVVFKGGTSLSKAYGIINRFSEDIDLCLPCNKIKSDSARKRLIEAITESIAELGLSISSNRNIERHGVYNNIHGNYKTVVKNSDIGEYIKIETAHRIKEYPTESRTISSYIGTYFEENAETAMIDAYSLEPFCIDTVSYYRTFIDKLFAVADYYMDYTDQNRALTRYSRHLYDIYKLIERMDWHNAEMIHTLNMLYTNVREERKASDKCKSAQDGISLKAILYELLNKDAYKSDYINVTQQLLYENVSYEQCKQQILNMLERGCLRID